MPIFLWDGRKWKVRIFLWNDGSIIFDTVQFTCEYLNILMELIYLSQFLGGQSCSDEDRDGQAHQEQGGPNSRRCLGRRGRCRRHNRRSYPRSCALLGHLLEELRALSPSILLAHLEFGMASMTIYM